MINGGYANIPREKIAELSNSWSELCREYPNGRPGDSDEYDALEEELFDLAVESMHDLACFIGGRLGAIIRLTLKEVTNAP